MEGIYLSGSEAVQQAGHTMSQAASDMKQAARNLDGSLERNQNFLNDWLMRFEAAVEKMPKTEDKR